MQLLVVRAIPNVGIHESRYEIPDLAVEDVVSALSAGAKRIAYRDGASLHVISMNYMVSVQFSDGPLESWSSDPQQLLP